MCHILLSREVNTGLQVGYGARFMSLQLSNNNNNNKVFI